MKRALILALTAFLMGACSAPVVRATRDNAAVGESDGVVSAIRPGEAIVVLNADTSFDDHKWPSSCVRGAIEGADTNIRIMAAKDFREELYPWAEADVSAEILKELMEKPLTRQRIDEMEVRYIIALDRITNPDKTGSEPRTTGGHSDLPFYVGQHGMMMCGAGPGGAGCLGLMVWKRTSDLRAIVWDVETGARAGTIGVKVSGTNVMPAFVLPIPIIAPTGTAACEEIGGHLARFVTTGELPVEAPVNVPHDDPSSEASGDEGS
jgi:hypothetical protein